MDVTARDRVDLTIDEERELARRIGTAWKELRRGAAMSILRDHLFGAGKDALEPGQVDTLDLLAREPAWRMSDLADALRVDPSTATRAVQRLERSGLAERRPSPDDGRVVIVSATALGLQRHGAIDERRRVSMSTLLSAFDLDERQELADRMDRLVASLDGFAEGLLGVEYAYWRTDYKDVAGADLNRFHGYLQYDF
jgi:DNA-binding MarR family transcriptional regulator